MAKREIPGDYLVPINDLIQLLEQLVGCVPPIEHKTVVPVVEGVGMYWCHSLVPDPRTATTFHLYLSPCTSQPHLASVYIDAQPRWSRTLPALPIAGAALLPALYDAKREGGCVNLAFVDASTGVVRRLDRLSPVPGTDCIQLQLK